MNIIVTLYLFFLLEQLLSPHYDTNYGLPHHVRNLLLNYVYLDSLSLQLDTHLFHFQYAEYVRTSAGL